MSNSNIYRVDLPAQISTPFVYGDRVKLTAKMIMQQGGVYPTQLLPSSLAGKKGDADIKRKRATLNYYNHSANILAEKVGCGGWAMLEFEATHLLQLNFWLSYLGYKMLVR